MPLRVARPALAKTARKPFARSALRPADPCIRIEAATSLPHIPLEGEGKLWMENGSQMQGKVLIVDDQRRIADALATIFRNAGYRSKAAYSAEAVLDSVEQWTPPLANLDVFLPGRNRMELAHRPREIFPGVSHPAHLQTVRSQRSAGGRGGFPRRDSFTQTHSAGRSARLSRCMVTVRIYP